MNLLDRKLNYGYQVNQLIKILCAAIGTTIFSFGHLYKFNRNTILCALLGTTLYPFIQTFTAVMPLLKIACTSLKFKHKP